MRPPGRRSRPRAIAVIPASSLKGTFADEWNTTNGEGRIVRSADGRWLFGETEAENAAAGALQFSEARLLAFPIRSAKGSFAWITCPLMLQRAARDGVVPGIKPDGQPGPDYLPAAEPADERGIWSGTKLDLGGQIVLEEYTFTRLKNGQNDVPMPAQLAGALARLLPDDPVWTEVKDRLVILSNGMLSFFAQNACEIAQHVRINDETGTAAGGALFNQENVPSETLFYSVVHPFAGRGEQFKGKSPEQALTALAEKLKAAGRLFQFGGDASTGLGYCSVKLAGASPSS